MKIYIYIFISLIVLTSMSCQEVINIDLEEGEKRLVVEGRVALETGKSKSIQEIRLTTTDDYFSNSTAPAATGAEVMISDNNGQSVILSEYQPGIYRSEELKPVVGNEYELIINYSGNTFRAIETLVSVPPIDTIYQVFLEKNLFNEEGIRVTIDYQDPVENINYYYWEQFQNGVNLIQPNPGTKFSLVSSDELYNGQYIRGRIINDNVIYTSGEQGVIRQIGLSEFAYRYYFAIFDQEGSRGNLSAPPAPIRGNIQNLTNPDNYALGYFYAAEISEKEIIIK
jgi:hypothetical protein